MWCDLLLIGKVWIRLHMTERNQLVGLTPTEGSHGSKQGIQESVLQSSAKDNTKYFDYLFKVYLVF